MDEEMRQSALFQKLVTDIPNMEEDLHVFSAECEEINRMIAFRDWLRTHEDDRILYEKTKLELAAQRWKYVQDYADAKSEVVQTILTRAMES